jgi:glycosyltransferase involved in cell wall biosynthesis
MDPLLSLIIPAHNEAFELPETLAAALAALRGVEKAYEIIVVNDASTDSTAVIASAVGARVIDVNLRKISAVRNAGARAAKGEFFLFLDADTRLPEATLRAAVAAMAGGAAGGGAWVRFDNKVGPAFHAVITLFDFLYMGVCRWAAGCFIFARRDAFAAAGGFDESLYVSEEIAFSRKLKKCGRFVILSESVVTSARKARLYSLWWPVRLLARMLVHGRRVLEQREGLELWYEGKREK